ncbi:MAG: hypothetical protein ACLFNM_03430 [Candidatus Woesearchaeota archaeon]
MKGNPYFSKEDVKNIIKQKVGIQLELLKDDNFLRKKAKELHLRPSTLSYYWSKDFDIEKEFCASATSKNIEKYEEENNKKSWLEEYKKGEKEEPEQNKNKDINMFENKSVDDKIEELIELQKRKDPLKNYSQENITHYVAKSSQENIKKSYELADELSKKANISPSVVFCARRAHFGLQPIKIEEEIRKLVDLVTYSSSVIKQKLTNLQQEVGVTDFSQIYTALENNLNHKNK